MVVVGVVVVAVVVVVVVVVVVLVVPPVVVVVVVVVAPPPGWCRQPASKFVNFGRSIFTQQRLARRPRASSFATYTPATTHRPPTNNPL